MQLDIKIVASDDNIFPKRSRTGVYSTNIMCSECDARIGKEFDEPAFLTLKREKMKPLFDDAVDVANKFYDANSEIIAKFIISMIWRASCSDHEFFGEVRLGPYEEIFRQYINREREFIFGPSEESCIVLMEYDEIDVPILSPRYCKFEGIKFLIFYFSNFMAIVKVDKRRAIGTFRDASLSPDRPVFSVLTSWRASNERAFMANLVQFTKHRVY